MQETRNNCFGLKICSTILRQVKTGKHECRNVAATLLFFWTRNNCWEFLASYDVTFQSGIKSFLKTLVFGAPLSFDLLKKYSQILDYCQQILQETSYQFLFRKIKRYILFCMYIYIISINCLASFNSENGIAKQQ